MVEAEIIADMVVNRLKENNFVYHTDMKRFIRQVICSVLLDVRNRKAD